MNVKVICIGKLKEKYWNEAVNEYMKRLGSYCRPEIVELKEARLPANASPADEDNVKRLEGEGILQRTKDGDYVITLEIQGRQLDSVQFAHRLEELAVDGRSNVDFVIGGSLGLSEAVSSRADFRLSFSKMTFPHQMMRVILLEQIYRAFKINKNEAYHK